jgi:phosphoribosylformylglycinamidine synthase
LDRLLFAEGGARILVSVPAAQADAWQQALQAADVPAQHLGVVSSQASLRVVQGAATLLEQSVIQLRERFEQAIPRRMGVDLPPTV